MNKKNRKGFTIVELVIVIAVIGILATVLVPTFGNVIQKANDSKAVQTAKSAYTEYVGNVNYAEGKTAVKVVYYVDGEYVVKVDGGNAAVATLPTSGCYNKITKDGVVSHEIITGEGACTKTEAHD